MTATRCCCYNVIILPSSLASAPVHYEIMAEPNADSRAQRCSDLEDILQLHSSSRGHSQRAAGTTPSFGASRQLHRRLPIGLHLPWLFSLWSLSQPNTTFCSSAHCSLLVQCSLLWAVCCLHASHNAGGTEVSSFLEKSDKGRTFAQGLPKRPLDEFGRFARAALWIGHFWELVEALCAPLKPLERD